jgi:hypothetical protein
MKKWMLVPVILAVCLLSSACNTPAPQTPTPNLEGTVAARVAMIATETAIVEAQAAMAAERASIAATQTALPMTSKALPARTPEPASASTPTVAAPAVASPSAKTEAPASAEQEPAPVPSATSDRNAPPGQTATNKAICPFYVYEGWNSDKNHYVPKGWMGDIADVTLDENYKLDSDPARPSVLQIVYTPRGGNNWAGIYWWDPPDADWANKDGGFDLSCASKLTFWAKGSKGGEKGEFKVGGLTGKYEDSLQPALSTGPITLTNEWKQYTLPLEGSDLRHIIGGFVWVTNRPGNPNGATIYVDDIRFE